MFKRIGTPVLIDSVCSFDPAKAVDLICRCGAVLGQTCGGVFAVAGERPRLITARSFAHCANCGESTNV